MLQDSTSRLSQEVAALTDAELVARARQGEELAFEAIVRRHNRLLFRAARGVVSDDAIAQDMVQEAYLRAFTHLHTFRGDAALKTWLTRIVINQSMSYLRRQRPVVALDDKGALLSIAQTEDDSMPSRLTDTQTPDAAVDRQQMKDLLQSAITHLPEAYRSVFMLREVEGMSVEETAYCLDVSRDVVKTRLLRARTQLRQHLAAQLEDRVQDTFQFAGARCDTVTRHVMDELRKRGIIH